MVHHSIYNLPPPVPTLSQFNPFYNFPSSFLKIHSNIILLLNVGLTNDLFLSDLSIKILSVSLMSSTRVTCPAHVILFYIIHLNNLVMITDQEVIHFLFILLVL
jgi:hypothetical protein